MRKITFLLVLILLIASDAVAVTETRYFNAKSKAGPYTHWPWTGGHWHKQELGSESSNSHGGITINRNWAPPGGIRVRFTVYIQHADGKRTYIANDIAEASHCTTGEPSRRTCTSTWRCPRTNLQKTDRIGIAAKVLAVDERGRVCASLITGGSGWETEELGATQLEEATWTFQVVVNTGMAMGVASCDFFFGGYDYVSKINGFSYNSYEDIGFRFRKGNETIKIGCVELESDHKLRIHKNGTTYGIPLLATNDPNASPIRVYDGGTTKALPELKY